MKASSRFLDISERMRAQNLHMSEVINNIGKLEAERVAAPLRQRERHHQELLQKHEELLVMERELLAEAKRDRWKVALITGIISAIIGAVIGAFMA